MARTRRPRNPGFNDYQRCEECGEEYSPRETAQDDSHYFDPPYRYDQVCARYCLACWLGVGPNDIRQLSMEMPAIVAQILVVFGEKTTEGQLIAAVEPAWVEIIRLIRDDPDAIFKIPPRKLEELIAGAYARNGFDRVTLTPRSGDHGRDVIAERSGWGCVRFVDQVKAYKPGHLVTAEEVRALAHVMQADRAASKGVVTTTSDFAPKIRKDPLIAPYLPTRIELINGVDLSERLVHLLDSAGK